jgi:hypothetical protein
MSSRYSTTLLLSFVGAAFVVGCDSEPGADPTVALTLGERHPALELLEFRAVGLDWIDDTTVAVIDRDDQQVVLLGLVSGSERRAAGRGGGPGELEGAFSLLGGDDGDVVVGDMSQNRVSHFSAGLEFLRSVQMPGMPLGLLAWEGDRVLALWMEFAFRDGAMNPEPTVGVVDLGSGEVEARFSLFAPESGLSRPREDNPFAPPFISAVRDSGGFVLAGQSMEYRIVALDSTGIMQWSLGRSEMPEQYLSAEEKADERGRRGRAGRRGGPPPADVSAMLEDALDAPQPYFGPNAFALDLTGRLWVITNRVRGDSTEVDVFDAEGAFLQTVALRDRVAALSIRGGNVVALVARTASEVEGVQGVDLYHFRD